MINLTFIIEGCKKQDEKCQELLYRNFAPKILSICKRYASIDFDADDLLQETFITVFDKIHKFDEHKGDILHWISKISINIALKKIRDKRIKLVEIANFDFSDSIADSIEASFTELSEEQIMEMIQQLPIGYRTVFNKDV